jgi:RimJ/RimL family protein N-acetyltransferase
LTELFSEDLLSGQLVRLAAPRPDDKDAMSRWTADAEYHRLLDDSPTRPRSADYFAEAMKEAEKDKEGERYRFGFRVRTLAEDKLIGLAVIHVFWQHQNGWLTIAIGETEFRNRGYGKDAFRLLVAYGFRELNLYKLNLGVFSYNARARHVYEKCGFVLEATQRAMLCRDGQHHDFHMMGMIRPEWEALRQLQQSQPAIEQRG